MIVVGFFFLIYSRLIFKKTHIKQNIKCSLRARILSYSSLTPKSLIWNLSPSGWQCLLHVWEGGRKRQEGGKKGRREQREKRRKVRKQWKRVKGPDLTWEGAISNQKTQTIRRPLQLSTKRVEPLSSGIEIRCMTSSMSQDQISGFPLLSKVK